MFEKMGVRSRRELVMRVFTEHHVPRMLSDEPLGAHGGFVS
jgi:hypothetical protein